MLSRVNKLAIFLLVLGLAQGSDAGVTGASKPIDQAYSYSSRPEVKRDPVKVDTAQSPQTWEQRWQSLKSAVATKVDSYLGQKKKVGTTQPKKSKVVDSVKEPAVNQANLEPPVEEKKLSDEVLELSGSEVADSAKGVRDVGETLGATQLFSAKVKGRVGTTNLPKTKAGTPKYDFAKLKVESVPSLDIGEEELISKKDLTGVDLAIIDAKYGKPRKLKSPKTVGGKSLKKLLAFKPRRIGKPRQLKKQKYGLGEVVSLRKIDNVKIAMDPSVDLPLKVMTKFERGDINMLGALMLYAKKDRCHVVIGLFSDLLKHPKYGNEAQFYLGACAHKMGFYSEAVIQLTQVVQREDRHYMQEAADLLMKEIPKEYNFKIAKAILGVKDKKRVKNRVIQRAKYLMAQELFRKGKFKPAKTLAQQISPIQKFYPDAQYLLGVSQYSLGQVKSAEKTLVNLKKHLATKGIQGTQLNSLASISLGRVQFNQARYKQALAQYISIKKDHPLWIEGLIEQGWTQLQLGDYAGAIGNMYSLHSPYFRSVFMPESHVIRTIGYLNICQFGDAYRTLSYLEKEHRDWYNSVDRYIKETKLARQYYETVKKYLRGKSNKNVDGLPYQVIREISRQKIVINYQKSMNEKEDELNQYGFINAMVKKDKAKIRLRMKQAEKRARDLKTKIALAKKDKKLVPRLNEWRGFFRNERKIARALRFELALYERGRQGYLNLKMATQKRFKKEKYVLGEKVGRNLVKNLYHVRSTIKEILSNNEYLRYEIFAGSGENIRYQVAGGSSRGANRIPASIKPSKSLNWDFAGEYWEDEIGSYRSSLVNNCPSMMGNEDTKVNYKGNNQSNNALGIQGEQS